MKNLQTFLEKIKNWQIALVILILGLILYANTFNNQLFWDDYDSVVNNQYIRDWSYFPKYFSENLTAGSGVQDNYWRPLLLISFAADYHVGKLFPVVYHFQNFLWHFFSTFLLYLIILKLFKHKLAALFAALIFLAHPLQTEAVTYVAGRADPMQATFLFLSFWFFLTYLSENPRCKYYIFSLIFFSGALLVKERAIVFPILLVLYLLTLYPEKFFPSWKKKIAIIIPFLTVAAIYALLRMIVLHFTDTFDLGQANNIGTQNIRENILIYFKGVFVYFGLLFWPAKLYMEKTLSVPDSLFDLSVIGGLILTVLSTIAIVYSWKNKKIVAFGMLWFWIALSPSLQVYPIQGFLYEHWLYFPMVGLLVCLIVPLFDLLSKKNSSVLNYVALSTLFIFVLGLGVRTVIRNNDWQDPITFYEKNVRLGGYSGRVYTNLGMAYAEAGKNKEAIEAYKKAIKLDERLFQPWYDMGNTLTDMGENDGAITAYRESIELNPHFIPAYGNSTKILVEQARFDEAIKMLKTADKNNPQNIQVLYNLGVVYYQKNDHPQARKYFQEALRLQPENIELIRLVNSL